MVEGIVPIFGKCGSSGNNNEKEVGGREFLGVQSFALYLLALALFIFDLNEIKVLKRFLEE